MTEQNALQAEENLSDEILDGESPVEAADSAPVDNEDDNLNDNEF